MGIVSCALLFKLRKEKGGKMKNLIVVCAVLLATGFAFSQETVEEKETTAAPPAKDVKSKVEDLHSFSKSFRRITDGYYSEELAFPAVEVLNAMEQYYQTRVNQYKADPVVDRYLNELALHFMMDRFRGRVNDNDGSYRLVWDKKLGEWRAQFVLDDKKSQ